jgi:hypothetical protein
LPTPFTRKRRYCFTGALDDAGAVVFEATLLTGAFWLATLVELAGFAVVALVGFLAAFFFEVVAVVVEPCGVAGGVVCANIAAAVNRVVKPDIRIVRFIFVSPYAGCFRSPLADPSCGHMPFGTLAPAGDFIAPPRGIRAERLLMKKR